MATISPTVVPANAAYTLAAADWEACTSGGDIITNLHDCIVILRNEANADRVFTVTGVPDPQFSRTEISGGGTDVAITVTVPDAGATGTTDPTLGAIGYLHPLGFNTAGGYVLKVDNTSGAKFRVLSFAATVA